MKTVIFVASAALLMLSAPAFADDFMATCKTAGPAMPAGGPPPGGAPSGPPPGGGAPSGPPPGMSGMSPDAFCTCLDQQTAGTPDVRTNLAASFKISDMQQRMSMLTPAAKAASDKCMAPPK